MRSKLFWRQFGLLTAVLMITVVVMSALMVTMVRTERRQALEAEVLLQARDVSSIIKQMDSISYQFWSRSGLSTLSKSLAIKLTEVQANYGAEIWVVSANASSALILHDQQPSTEEDINDPAVLMQIGRILSGEEILVQGMFESLGKNIITVGVPTSDSNGIVNGAVLMHVEPESMMGEYQDVLRYALIAAALAMVLGTVLAYYVARRMTTPLGKINIAVKRFAAGQLDERVEEHGNDEIAQLAHSFNKMAEDLSQLEMSRRNFVASVSHELRSPLTCISGYVQGMQDATIPESEHAKYLGVVRSEADRLTKLTNELLDLSRLESGNFSLTITRFDINELIRLELIKFEQKIDDKHLDVDVIFKENQLFVMADSDRIRQVITNLIDNAVKFTNDGGSLEISSHLAGDRCFVTVKDDGIGIDDCDLPFIFDRFFKADKAHTSGMGTGLGLSIAKHIMEQHGQELRVQSGASGTAFTMTLQLARGDNESDK